MKVMVKKKTASKRLNKRRAGRARVSSVDATVSKNVLHSHKKLLMDITFCSIMLYITPVEPSSVTIKKTALYNHCETPYHHRTEMVQ